MVAHNAFEFNDRKRAPVLGELRSCYFLYQRSKSRKSGTTTSCFCRMHIVRRLTVRDYIEHEKYRSKSYLLPMRVLTAYLVSDQTQRQGRDQGS